jgi:hypothetical protein
VKTDRTAWLAVIPIFITGLAIWHSHAKEVQRKRIIKLDKATSTDQNQSNEEIDQAIIQDEKAATINKNCHPQKTHHTWLEKSAIAIAVLAFLAASWQGWVARDAEKLHLRA